MKQGGRAAGGCSSLTIDLFAPGMTALHRVGLAGLSMTLQSLESDGAATKLRSLGSWRVSDRDVTLSWDANGEDFFAELIRASFRLTPRGLIWFPALGDPLDHAGHAAVLHNAMLGTFLQHTKSRDRSTRTPEALVIDVDGEAQVINFLPLARYAHQRVVIHPSRRLKVAGWLYPGGVVRHVQATAATALTESPERALALLYASVGAIYFQIHRRAASSRRARYAVVLPEVIDLLAHADARRLFVRQGITQLQVAGATEAAVRVLAELEAHGLLRKIAVASCEGVGFGVVPWSPQQKTRVDRFRVEGVRPERLVTYQMAMRVFRPRLVTGQTNARTGQINKWWDVPQVPDLVATNVITGAPWWRGFGALWRRVRDSMTQSNREWALRSEREGLEQMVDHPGTMQEGPEVSLVRACQEALRRRFGALGERSRKEGVRFGDLASREYERIRISFARCRNGAMLRQTLTDFWVRAGPLPDLQEAWPGILPILNDRWQDARDLALLALASYRPRSKEEAGALATDEQILEEGDSP